MMEMSSLEPIFKDGNAKNQKRKLILAAFLVCAACFGLGVLIGHFSAPKNKSILAESWCKDGVCLGSDVPTKIVQDGEPGITEKIIDNIQPALIRENLRKWTLYPHLAGTEGSLRLAEELLQTWQQQGLDYVEKKSYEVLLSYPDRLNPNEVYLLDGSNSEIFRSAPYEAILTPDQNSTDTVPPYNAYSPAGDVTGQLVYINYCRKEDFEHITTALGIKINGNIAICRYGKIFRGDKAKFASQYGTLGLILYSDPGDYTGEGEDSVIPDSWWLPPTGIQRGTVYAGDGDPLTPGYPASATAYRLNISEVEGFPTIPVTPIGYGDALLLMQKMSGPEVPAEWRGRMNMTYKLGPGFLDDTWKVRLDVNTEYELVNTTNVFGYIYGSVEPDRYVLMGNHRDAWAFGAVDPTSGTAVMAEISRVLAKLVKEGWRPRRTIVFCSWGAEEFGLLGSYEWVEEFNKKLGARSVAYLNLDVAVTGNHTLKAQGVPLLNTALYDVAKRIQSPTSPQQTIYEEWMANSPNDDGTNPMVSTIGSGSDHAPFLLVAGVPATYPNFVYDKKRWKIAGYPLYHSVYETFSAVDRFVDPGFVASAAIARFDAEMIRYLSDSLILPLDVTAYGNTLVTLTDGLKKGYGDLMQNNSISLDALVAAVKNFKAEADEFQKRLNNVNKRNPLEVRMYNDQMMLLERYFLDSSGLPGRPFTKHILFAPSINNAYAGSTFPGLVDLMAEIQPDDPQFAQKWEEVKRHLAIVIYTIDAAASSLKSPKNI